MRGLSLPAYLALISVMLALPIIGCSGVSDVRDNLNDQRALYDLPAVSGETCTEVILAFDGYEELVTTPVPADDPAWEVLTSSECKTFQAHVDAYNAYCEEVLAYVPAEDTVSTCAGLNSWR